MQSRNIAEYLFKREVKLKVTKARHGKLFTRSEISFI